MQLTLSKDDAATLREILGAVLSDLRVEVRRTDAYDLREGIRAREHLVERLVAELGGAQSSV